MGELTELLARMRAFYRSGATRPIAARVAALRRLKQAIREAEPAIRAAMYGDFGKCGFDAFATELLMVYEEIDAAVKGLRRWSRPRRVAPGLVNFPARARVIPEPLGTALILSPWNYPFLLAVGPLVGAVAAGNCVVLKPSAKTPRTATEISRILGKCFPGEWVSACQGGHDLSDALLAQRFDLIFFTGSAAVGRRVLERAAQHLTPVILELGGKSPCIVDASADPERAARRIAWGKFTNAGQTCVAPDYVLAHRSVLQPLVTALCRQVQSRYYDGEGLSPDYPRIITADNYDRLMSYLAAGRAACGGWGERESLRIAPTILIDVKPDSAVMLEEIFGPILPVLPFDALDEALAFVNERPKPLALYAFGEDQRVVARILAQTSSGGGCVNDTLMHIAAPSLPFGGVGESGMGKYHGRYSFDAFSNLRCVLFKGKRELSLRYPPHAPQQVERMRRLLRQ